MKRFWFLTLLFIPSSFFSQYLEQASDTSGNVGVRLADLYASSKGKLPNEAFYLNTLLYYRGTYNIKDDEVLGTLTGRITKTEPLSSVTLAQLEKVRNPQGSYSNLLRNYPAYQKALSDYDLFVRLFEKSLKEVAGITNAPITLTPSSLVTNTLIPPTADTNLPVNESSSNIVPTQTTTYPENDPQNTNKEDVYEYYDAEVSPETPLKESEAPQDTPKQINSKKSSLDDFYYDNSYDYGDTTSSNVGSQEGVDNTLSSLQRQRQHFVAQNGDRFYKKGEEPYSALSQQAIEQPVFSALVPAEPFPPLAEVFKESSKSLTAQELEFLIRYEEISHAYSNTVIEYQKVLAAKKQLEEPSSFNHGDTNELFRVVLSGDDNSGLTWVKGFRLDGEKTYQSYDPLVWFLNYEIPLTKKDISLLSKVYMKSKTIYLQIIGRGGSIRFPLSETQKTSFRSLFEQFVMGRMVKPELEEEISPLLR